MMRLGRLVTKIAAQRGYKVTLSRDQACRKGRDLMGVNQKAVVEVCWWVVDVSVREKLESSFLACGGSRGEEG